MQDAVRYLRGYQRWRRGADGRTFEEAGLDAEKIGDALDTLLDGVATEAMELKRTRGMLRKCRLQREEYHARLRSKREA